VTSDSGSIAAIPSALRGSVVWLEDDPTEDRVEARRRAVEKLGFEVVIAEGFRELEQLLQQRVPSGPSVQRKVRLIVIDIMISGVNDLSVYFPWVTDARTAKGYAAGLVFLERVLFPEKRSDQDTLFGQFEGIPVIVYSARTVPPDEMSRLTRVGEARGIKIAVLAKANIDAFVKTAEELTSPVDNRGGAT
jgi:hypothetical protein